MEFKERLKNLRKEKKYTQVNLSEMLNYGYTAIANYESGRNEPSIADLKKIAAIFDVSLDYLLGVSDTRRPYIMDEETLEFQKFHQYFSMLHPEGREHLLVYMQFLLDKEACLADELPDALEEQPLPHTVLRVAQKMDELT